MFLLLLNPAMALTADVLLSPRLLPNSTREVNLTIINANPEFGDEIISIKLVTNAFSITSTTDDDTEGDWMFSSGVFSGHTIIPGEQVVFTLNITSIASHGIYPVNITLTDNSSTATNVTLYVAVVEPGDIGIEVSTPNGLPKNVNTVSLLSKNDSLMDTLFLGYPDIINESDETIQPFQSSNGLILFDASSLNQKNASGVVYINISTDTGRIKYQYSYDNTSYNTIKIVDTKIRTYYDTNYEIEKTVFSTRLEAHHMIYFYVNGSYGLYTVRAFNITNLSENASGTISGSNGFYTGSINVSSFNENTTKIRLEANNGTYVFFTYLTIDSQPPPHPENLTSEAPPGNGTVILNWSDVDEATYYKIYRNGTYIGNTSTSTYTDYTANLNTTYYYNVTSIDSVGNEGSWSVGTENRTSETDEEPPNPVSDIIAKSISSGRILLNWSKPEGEPIFLYTIWRNSSGTWERINNTTSTYYIDTNLTSGTKYYYKVEASDSSGNKVNSSIVSNKSDSTAPIFFGQETAILKTDLDNDGVAEINDIIEINITELYDRFNISEPATYPVRRVYANLSLLGGPEEANFTNTTQSGWNYTLSFTIKSGNVDNSTFEIPLVTIDKAGNIANSSVVLNNVYNYKSKIENVEIRQHGSSNVVSGNLQANTWYDVYITFNSSLYRGDTYFIVEVNDSSGMVYFGYQYVPSVQRHTSFNIAQGFRTSSSNITVRIFIWNTWVTDSSFYPLTSVYSLTKTVS